MVWFHRRTKLLIVLLLVMLWAVPGHAQLMKLLVSTPPTLIIDGVTVIANSGYTFTVLSGVTSNVVVGPRTIHATVTGAGGGGGGEPTNAPAGEGSGGGQGAYDTTGESFTMAPGQSFQFLAGAQAPAGTNGNYSYALNVTSSAYIFYLGGGTLGQNGAVNGPGGVVIVGTHAAAGVDGNVNAGGGALPTAVINGSYAYGGGGWNVAPFTPGTEGGGGYVTVTVVP